MWTRRAFITSCFAGLMGSTGAICCWWARPNKTLPIVQYPSDQLRTVSTAIDPIDSSIVSLAKAMKATLRNKAVSSFFFNASLYKGLAAPQVGVQKRLIVCGIRGEIKTLVNPEMIYTSGTFSSNEFCLSLPQHATTLRNHTHPQKHSPFPFVTFCQHNKNDHLNHQIAALD